MTTRVLTSAVAAQEGGDWVPKICRPLVITAPYVDPTPVSDVTQCPGYSRSNPDQCGAPCIVDISGSPVGERAPELILRDALRSEERRVGIECRSRWAA